MALLSRSLRGSVRRLEPPGLEKGDRRSSPDCLDTSKDSKSRNPLKPSRPRTNRTRRDSSSSVNTVASGQLTTPATRTNGNGLFKTPRARRDLSTPSATDLLRDVNESPDPLDTISPAPSVAKQRTVTPANVDSNLKPPVSPVTRTTRRNDNRSLADENATKEEGAAGGATPTRGIKSEAPGKQSASVDTRSGRRSLRSTDTGSRCKSELAQYFHNYEQIISLEDPEPEFLAAKTTITLVDDLSQPPLSSKPDPAPFGNPLLKLYDCEKITLPKPANTPAIDPLGEETYFRAHRKFERQEKQLRNIERNRAQHEQQVLERLLDELRGHDWLRVMGLTGVHESDKKLYEPKRDILIQELVTLVNKFQAWKDEERRRKLEKEKAQTVPGEAAPNAPRQHSRKRSRPAEDVDSSPGPGIELQSTPDADADPDPSDIDALAARQLHQEARSASAVKSRKTAPRKPISKPPPNNTTTNTTTDNDPEPKPTPKRKKPNQTPTKPQSQPPTSASAPTQKPARHLQQASLSHFWKPAPRDGPFTSFFRQRHVREAAIAATKGTRRGGSRSTLAFGYSVPDQPEQDFELPPDILNEESIMQSQRKRRRLKRGSLG
ncbi:hypothetical protein N7491_009944 [Penicillium cf. griseofulvum]|uniref:Something about silencing protein 4 domain-containing protein n=1 Tax=Penicillium cf. griseofulvum TaxID=2972120 RepID=A0A9W9MYX5_9EURO|nr:hypothetical protein N7472_000273 [Penicillium cf. griseofulvum]KAJ5421499.1 hypothetical protein N7491_009944 [Penicillium cf. griseofulvum]KAJ5424731.1 hypothetical protein N7445_010704 [Penicillium cf. griseofulvum]